MFTTSLTSHRPLLPNKYECTIDQELRALLHLRTADASFSLIRGSDVKAAIFKSKIRLCRSMRIYMENIPAKCHPDPI